MRIPGSAAAILVLLLSLPTPSNGQDAGWSVTFPGGEQWQCIVADTWSERANGLRYYETLPDQTCMLFVYPLPIRPSFWMPPEMQFSLDILFLDPEKRIVHIVDSAPPCPDPLGRECPSYVPQRDCLYVIELPAGTAKRLALEIGDPVTIVTPE